MSDMNQEKENQESNEGLKDKNTRNNKSIFTKEMVQSYLPRGIRANVTDGLVKRLNALTTEPELEKEIKDNFLSFTSVLQEGKFKLEDYLNAVAYVTFKLRGYNNREAWKRTFPDKWQEYYFNQKKDMKEIDSIIVSYSKGKLVNLILEQTLIPVWLYNQDAYQEAINTQVRLMRTAQSERVQMMAADSLLNHLKKPETAIDNRVNININATSIIDDLRENIKKLAETQQGLIKAGVTAKEVAEKGLIVDAEYTEQPREPEEE